jgi:virulence-associated protein VagC
MNEDPMRTGVTEQGVLVPKRLLEGTSEVEIRKENGVIVIVPLPSEDPILQLGRNPVDDDPADASVEHDRYIYSK